MLRTSCDTSKPITHLTWPVLQRDTNSEQRNSLNQWQVFEEPTAVEEPSLYNPMRGGHWRFHASISVSISRC